MINDTKTLRKCLSNFATGITVITPSCTQTGLTISSFTSVSLSPPLILFCVSKSSSCYKHFINSSDYVVNVLSQHQQDMSQHFASEERTNWNNIPYLKCKYGYRLIDSVATLECSLYEKHEAGDHVIFIAQVQNCDVNVDESVPLLYHHSQYKSL